MDRWTWIAGHMNLQISIGRNEQEDTLKRDKVGILYTYQDLKYLERSVITKQDIFTGFYFRNWREKC